jgi:hypothetical protein
LVNFHDSGQDEGQKQGVIPSPLCDCESTGDAPANPSRPWIKTGLEMGLVLALWLLHCAANFWWIRVDTRPPYSDMAGHAIATLRIASWPWRQALMDGSLLGWLLDIHPYPPFFYMTALPLVWFVSPTVDTMLVVNMLYFGLLIFSTYGIGRLAVGGRCGLLAAFLVSMYPMLYGLSRLYLTDVALAAMTTFAVFCIFWSDSFRHRLPSLVLGGTIALGVLTKWTFIVFLLGPLAIAVYLALRHPTRARLINLVVAGVLALAIGLPWYLHNLEALREFLQFNRFQAAPQEGETAVWTMASWLYYLSELVNQQLLLPFTLLFGAGTLLALRRCKANAYLLMFVAWIVIGYIASTLYINKDSRYTLPYLPAMALLSAIGFVQIRQVMVKRVGLVLIVLYALLQYSGLTVGLSNKVAWMPEFIRSSQGPLAVTLYAESVHVAGPPRSENWQVDAIVEALLADLKKQPAQESRTEVVVVPNTNWFDTQAFSYVRWRDRLFLNVSEVTGIVEVDSASALQQSDYVVTKSGDLGWDFALQDAEEITVQLLDPNSALRAEFELLAEFPLPDNSTAQLFRHNH